MPLVVGLAATGLVLSTTSVAFIGLPMAKTPSKSDSSLRGETGRMAFSSEAVQMDDLAVDATSEVEAEEVGTEGGWPTRTYRAKQEALWNPHELPNCFWQNCEDIQVGRNCRGRKEEARAPRM